MEIKKQHIKEMLKNYMLENDLGYISLNASMSIDRRNVIMSITEEEDEDINNHLWN